MKTKIFVLLTTLLFLATLTAQEVRKMYIMKDGEVTHKIAITDIDSIVFDNTTVEEQEIKITPDMVTRGYLLSSIEKYTSENNWVVTNNEEWENMKSEVRFSYRQSSDLEVDFDAYQVIAVFNAGGWTINIADITEYPDSIVVTVQNTAIESKTAYSNYQAYHVVKIPASNKKVVFQQVTQDENITLELGRYKLVYPSYPPSAYSVQIEFLDSVNLTHTIIAGEKTYLKEYEYEIENNTIRLFPETWNPVLFFWIINPTKFEIEVPSEGGTLDAIDTPKTIWVLEKEN